MQIFLNQSIMHYLNHTLSMPTSYGDKTLAQITVFTSSRKRHLDLSIGAIHKGCLHISGGGGEGDQAKVDKCGQGEGGG